MAAVVGIFKPYVGDLKRWHFAVAALVSLILVGSFADPKAVSEQAPVEAPEEKSAESGTAADVAPKAPPSKWTYDEQIDQMRGTVTKTARVTSLNEVNLQFPYGTVGGYLDVRKRPTDGLNIMFSVDSGQILCRSYSDGHISVKFDDQPIKNYGCDGASDGSSDVAFIRNESGFLANLKKSKKVIIEAEFYQQGRQQFMFDTAGLEWK
ncbi:hypothetical protein ASD67_10710 [Sphingopyxis sp. Root1497]|uniref:hypothetical protein n=1 Tax=Sphingopyxis sp. Root1497 TaxID=1736474 RepID=UPI0007142027|nr:hypothetical protein [Sphingopyxis sp. Root1497]KQZ64877.1 hypothetical protein ASD67_10710 [Sphingopyxis sp. Root1497]